METINLKDFREFIEPWTRAMRRQYGSKFTQEAPQTVVNTIVVHSGKKPETILGGSQIRVTSGSDRDDKDPTKTFVSFEVVGPERTKDGGSKTGHGAGTPYAGKVHTVPRSTYLFAVQPGLAPSTTQQQTPPTS